jgi:hypothetical protein
MLTHSSARVGTPHVISLFALAGYHPSTANLFSRTGPPSKLGLASVREHSKKAICTHKNLMPPFSMAVQAWLELRWGA